MLCCLLLIWLCLIVGFVWSFCSLFFCNRHCSNWKFVGNAEFGLIPNGKHWNDFRRTKNFTFKLLRCWNHCFFFFLSSLSCSFLAFVFFRCKWFFFTQTMTCHHCYFSWVLFIFLLFVCFFFRLQISQEKFHIGFFSTVLPLDFFNKLSLPLHRLVFSARLFRNSFSLFFFIAFFFLQSLFFFLPSISQNQTQWQKEKRKKRPRRGPPNQREPKRRRRIQMPQSVLKLPTSCFVPQLVQKPKL